MSIALSDLISRLQGDVPARNGVPSATQYEQAVKDAVWDYSTRNPMQKRTSLNIISGTAAYSLPDDFLKIIILDDVVVKEDNVIVSDEGIIPLTTGFAERYHIGGGQITFYPTPAYTSTRYLWYAAAHVLDGSQIYQEMTEQVARIVLLKAQSLSLRLQANQVVGSVSSYKDGDVQVDFSKRESSYATRIKSLLDEYEQALRVDIGAVIMQTQWDL